MPKPVILTFLGDASQLNREFAKINAESGKSGGFMSKLGAVGKVALGGLAAGGAAVGLASIKMADNYEIAHAKLTTALANSGGASAYFKQHIDALKSSSEGLGFTNTQTEEALAVMTTGMGSSTKAMQAMGIAQDIARQKGIDLSQAAMLVTKASEGQLRPLKQAGIDLPIAAGGALKVEKAQAALAKAQQNANVTLEKYHAGLLKGPKAWDALRKSQDAVRAAQEKLTETQKAGGSILEALGQKFSGAAARNADTFHGKMEALKAKAEDLGVKIGMVLVPILLKLATWISDTLVPSFETLVAWVQDHWPQIQETISETVTKIQNVVETVVGVITAVWSRFHVGILTVVQGVWGAIKGEVQGAIDVVRGIIETVTALIHGDWSGVWEGISSIFSGVWEGMKGIVTGALGMISGSISIAGGIISFAWAKVWGALSGMLSGIWGGITGAISSGFGAVASLWGTLTGGLSGAWNAVWNGLSGAATGAWNTAKEGVKSVINGAISIMNSGIKLLNKIQIHVGIDDPTGLTGGIHWDWNGPQIPTIPQLANGGIFSRPTLAMIGEAGTEAVIPLNRPTRAAQIMQAAGLGGGAGTHVTKNITQNIYAQTNADPVEISRELAWAAKTGGY